MKNTDKNSLSRRQALEKLAKCSIYTAPTVITLLASNPSYAQGSGVSGATCVSNNGSILTNRNPNFFAGASNAGGNSNTMTIDTASDCGNNVPMNA